MKKHLFRLFLAAGVAAFSFASCSTMKSIGDQLVSIANLANCEYSMKNANNISVAGVKLSDVTNGNISVSDIAKITSAVMQKRIPLSMDVNVDVKNPTATDAALTAMDWIMYIDGVAVATGVSSQAYTIGSNATTTVTLPVSTDIYNVCQNLDAVKNLVQSFTTDGKSSQIGLKIKPSLNVAGVLIPMPDYITIQKGTGNTGTTETGSSGKTIKVNK